MQHPPVVQPSDTGLRRGLAVAGTWAAVSLVLALFIGGVPSAAEFGVFLLSLGAPTLLTALVVRFVGRGRGWPFWLLFLLAAPFFWTLRALQNLVVG